MERKLIKNYADREMKYHMVDVNAMNFDERNERNEL